MLTVKTVHLEPEKYGTALQCAVTFQLGSLAYNTVKVPLSPEATREIVDLIIKQATQALTVTGSEIAIAGEPLALAEPDVPEDPDFAEVVEAASTFAPAPAYTLPEEAF